MFFLALHSLMLNSIASRLFPRIIEEPGEQCTVVFALILTEPASECVCAGKVGGGGGG